MARTYLLDIQAQIELTMAVAKIYKIRTVTTTCSLFKFVRFMMITVKSCV